MKNRLTIIVYMTKAILYLLFICNKYGCFIIRLLNILL